MDLIMEDFRIGQLEPSRIGPVLMQEVASSVTYLAEPSERISQVEETAYHAMMVILRSNQPFHAWTIAQATRGILHGFVQVGYDISHVAPFAAAAISKAISSAYSLSVQAEKGIRAGVQMTMRDLGLAHVESDRARNVHAKEQGANMFFVQSAL